MKRITVLITLLICVTACSVYTVSPASADATNTLPTIDPQARQILAAMVNSYSDMEEYADEESIGSMGDTLPSFPKQINSHYTVALKRGSGIFLTSSDPGGALVTVHAFPESTDLLNQHFLVFTTDTRHPGLYTKETVSDYQEALAHSFQNVGLGTSGATALFSKGDISSLLLEPGFNGLQLGEPLSVVNVTCDRVTVNIGSDSETNSLIFYIGQKDHLLRQLSIIHNQGAPRNRYN